MIHSLVQSALGKVGYRIGITDAHGAKEHLDCSLPKIDDISDYASDDLR